MAIEKSMKFAISLFLLAMSMHLIADSDEMQDDIAEGFSNLTSVDTKRFRKIHSRMEEWELNFSINCNNNQRCMYYSFQHQNELIDAQLVRYEPDAKRRKELAKQIKQSCKNQSKPLNGPWATKIQLSRCQLTIKQFILEGMLIELRNQGFIGSF